MSAEQINFIGILLVALLALVVFGGVTYLTRNWT
jgi:hypothetical protein